MVTTLAGSKTLPVSTDASPEGVTGRNQPAEYAQWGSVAVNQLLSNVLPVPIFVENDAAAAAMGEMQFGLGQQYQSFFYVLITMGLGGGLVIDGQYFRGATGRSGELGLINRRDTTGVTQQLQNTVSLSALYARLAAPGYRVASPRELTHLDAPAQRIVDDWMENSVDALEEVLLSINYLINPEAILIGGRLPATLVERLASRLNDRFRSRAATMPSVAHIRRAAMSDDRPLSGLPSCPSATDFYRLDLH